MANLVKNTTIYALGDIIPKLFSFVTFPILTHYLSPAEYGIINYVNTLNVFLLVFSVLCLNTYYLVFYYRQENEELQQRLLGNLSVFILGVTTAISILAYTTGFLFTDLFKSEISFYPYIAIGIAINFFNVFSVLPLALYRLEEHPLPVALINVIKSGLTMFLTVLLVVKFNYRALGVLWATLIVSGIFAIWFIVLTVRKSIICFDWRQIKSALVFSLPLVPGSLAYYLVSMSDRILVEKYAGLTELGIYSTASTIALLLNLVSVGAYKAFEPYFFKIYGTSIFGERFEHVHNAFLFFLLLGATVLSLYAKEFLSIMSSESFWSAYLYVPILLIGVVSSSMCNLYGTILTAQGKTKINSMISMIGGFSSVIMNILLLPRLGITAACMTSAFAFLGMLIASILLSRIRIPYKKILIALILTFILTVGPVYCLELDSMLFSILVKLGCFIILSLITAKLLNFKFREVYGNVFN